MTTTLLSLALAGLISAGDPTDTPRKPSAIAPSLHELTDDEEAELDRIIDRFIDGDIGKLRGADAKKARQEFDKLGPDAIPALIRGINKAAKIEGSCPATIIAKKLSSMLAGTEDVELLEFVRENAGAGVGRTQHSGILHELRVNCALRKSELARRGITEKTPTSLTATERPPRSMTVSELAEAAGKDRGPRLNEVLNELGKRKGAEVVSALGTAAASYDGDTRQLARDLLERTLRREGQEVVKEKLTDDRAEVRAMAARVAADKGWKFGKELIDLLGEDAEASVRDAAHQALVKMNKGKDLGPDTKATSAEKADALARWREWWAKQARP
ncbi:MAG TPA: hypothetical protein VGG61_00600 [Gemmataceae bacterium]